MSNSDSTRKISQDFLDSLKSGELSQLTKMVKNRDDLIMCFREGYICVYYNSCIIFEIKELDNNYSVNFDMGYARYTNPEDREKRWCDLKAKIPNINLNHKNTQFYVKKNNEVFDFETVYEIYKSFINDRLDNNLQYDYFKAEAGEKQSQKRKKRSIESIHQQKLFSEYFSNNNEYIFYDVKLTISRNNNSEKHLGSPDCLAIRMENGNPKAIVLVEVKSTEAACGGNNGIKAHYEKYENMINNEKYKDNIKNITINIIESYNYLGFLDIEVEKIMDIVSFEKLFIFTTSEVKKWADTKRPIGGNYEFYLKLTDSEKMFVNYD